MRLFNRQSKDEFSNVLAKVFDTMSETIVLYNKPSSAINSYINSTLQHMPRLPDARLPVPATLRRVFTTTPEVAGSVLLR